MVTFLIAVLRLKNKKRVDIDSQENASFLRSKISSSVEDAEAAERLKKRKDKVKDTRPKAKETKDKDGEVKEKGKEAKEIDDRPRKKPAARPACSFCHIPYHYQYLSSYTFISTSIGTST
jgi:hypothetical protein